MQLTRLARDLGRTTVARGRGTLTRARFHAAFPDAHLSADVKYDGDLSRTHLDRGVTIGGPTCVYVTDGGGLTGARLTIGDRTYVGEFNNIRCAGAPITIGSDCLVSQMVTIVGSNHGIAPGRPIPGQDWDGEGVVIGDDVWLGAGTTVLPGARIGDGCVVAANSVVRGVVEPGSIVAGSPARVIGRRDDRGDG